MTNQLTPENLQTIKEDLKHQCSQCDAPLDCEEDHEHIGCCMDSCCTGTFGALVAAYEAQVAENTRLREERDAALLQAELANAGYSGWYPSPENTNLLPDPVRKYVADLQTNCDPAGYVSDNACLTEQRDALVIRVQQESSRAERAEAALGQAMERLEKLTGIAAIGAHAGQNIVTECQVFLADPTFTRAYAEYQAMQQVCEAAQQYRNAVATRSLRGMEDAQRSLLAAVDKLEEVKRG